MKRSIAPLRAVGTSVLASLLCGCFGLQQVEPGTPLEADTEARVELTDAGLRELPSRAPVREGAIRGRVVRWGRDSVAISYPVSELGTGSSPGGGGRGTLRDTTTLPRTALRTVAVPRLQPAVSLLMAGAAVGGVALGFVAASSGGDDRGGDLPGDTGGAQPAVWIPLSLPFP